MRNLVWLEDRELSGRIPWHWQRYGNVWKCAPGFVSSMLTSQQYTRAVSVNIGNWRTAWSLRNGTWRIPKIGICPYPMTKSRNNIETRGTTHCDREYYNEHMGLQRRVAVGPCWPPRAPSVPSPAWALMFRTISTTRPGKQSSTCHLISSIWIIHMIQIHMD